MVDNQFKLRGYHGTLMNSAKKIKCSGFLPSNKDNEWLGPGVYFFTRIEHASYWADEQNKRHPGGGGPAVLWANLHVNKDGLLDLDIPFVMRKFSRECQEVVKEVQGAPRFKDNSQLRCFFCKYYVSMHNEVQVLAYTFPRESKPIEINDFGFPVLLGRRQLCVVDMACIEMPVHFSEVV